MSAITQTEEAPTERAKLGHMDSKQKEANEYKVSNGWRVGHVPQESTTRSGLLVSTGSNGQNDALALVDVTTGRHFWAVPTGAWRFLWPPTGKPVVAVRQSQIIAEEEPEQSLDEGQYL